MGGIYPDGLHAQRKRRTDNDADDDDEKKAGCDGDGFHPGDREDLGAEESRQADYDAQRNTHGEFSHQHTFRVRSTDRADCYAADYTHAGLVSGIPAGTYQHGQKLDDHRMMLQQRLVPCQYEGTQGLENEEADQPARSIPERLQKCHLSTGVAAVGDSRCLVALQHDPISFLIAVDQTLFFGHWVRVIDEIWTTRRVFIVYQQL
mmetsp:Transcript_6261/g.15498  ORF Transcript_6261/g.15498 Transcript_6261/m.15498 type:complete len:205 (+) Transcript_6261:2489-3103(+)